VDVADMTVFRLSGRGTVPVVADGPGIVPVAALDVVGSESLGVALAERSLPAVLEALAFDVVLVPVTTVDGVVVSRVFPTPGEVLPALCLFSSAPAFEAFLGEDGGRLFVMVHGAAVVDYVAHRLADVGTVVVDPAGPTSMVVSAAGLASFLDDGDTPVVEDELVADAPEPVVTGFDLGLDGQWGRIDVTDEERRDRQILTLVGEQTRTLGDDAVLLRRDMRNWLTRVARDAAAAGGSELGFLLARTRDAAAALSVVTYCHRLGAETGGLALDAVTEHLAANAAPDDELVRIETPGGPIVRHARLRPGSSQVGGEKVPLVVVDYWVAAPDRDHVAHVSFTTPHVDARPAILLLADNVVFNGQWLTEDPPTVSPSYPRPPRTP
jgi:hypothetical protein